MKMFIKYLNNLFNNKYFDDSSDSEDSLLSPEEVTKKIVEGTILNKESLQEILFNLEVSNDSYLKHLHISYKRLKDTIGDDEAHRDFELLQIAHKITETAKKIHS